MALVLLKDLQLLSHVLSLVCQEVHIGSQDSPQKQQSPVILAHQFLDNSELHCLYTLVVCLCMLISH